MLVVESRRRPILFTDCVDAGGITQRVDVRRPHFGTKCICGRAPTAKRVIDNGMGRGGQEPFGEWLGLRKQRPRPESRGQPLVGPLPGVCGRKNVKESETFHSLRVIERKTIRGTTAPIMPGD